MILIRYEIIILGHERFSDEEKQFSSPTFIKQLNPSNQNYLKIIFLSTI